MAVVIPRRHTLLLLAIALLSLPLLAQTDDHDEEDRRYQERLARPAPVTVEDQRQAMVDLADKLIRDSRDYASKSTTHWQVRTDDPGVDVAASSALLESFRTWFLSFWKGRVETAPNQEIGRVYVFTSFHDYNALLTGDPRHGDFRPAGHYNLSTDLVALYLGSIDRAALPDTLVHEGAHMMATRMIFRGRPTTPWLAEGLAGYFEFTARDGKGGFQTGAVAGSQAKSKLRAFKKLLDADPPWSVEPLLGPDDPQAFYGEGAQGRYAASWLLVHALFHEGSGRHAAAFARFISRAAEDGEATAERLYEATGLDAATLTAMVAAHARALDVK